MRSRLLTALALTAIMYAQALGQPGVRLTYRWSADTARIGEPVTLRLDVVLPEGSIPHFPQLEVNNPAASLVQTRLEPLAAEYVFTFWEVGRVVLPGIPVRIVDQDGSGQTFQTDSLSIMIASVLTGQEQDIRGIKSMVPLKLTNPRSLWFRVGVMVILLSVIALIWRSRKQTASEKVLRERYLKPEATARRALKNLGAADYQPPRAGEFYYDLSKVLRRYLEERYLFRALEMTTSEIQDTLPGEVEDQATAALIVQVLEQSDLAKFADRRHPQAQWQQDLDVVGIILDRTQPTFKV